MPNGAAKEIEAVKRLLILLLLKLGATSDEIGLALNLDSSRVRQLIPVSKVQKIELHRGK
jgi:hypothetical protein